MVAFVACSRTAKYKRKVMARLLPLIEERLRESADQEEKQVGFQSYQSKTACHLALTLSLISKDDLISWLIDAAPPMHRNAKAIAKRVLIVSFSGLITTPGVSCVRSVEDTRAGAIEIN